LVFSSPVRVLREVLSNFDGSATFDLFVLRNDVTQFSFPTLLGVLAKISSLEYDGGTDLGSLNIKKTSGHDFFMLFSDGLSTLGMSKEGRKEEEGGRRREQRGGRRKEGGGREEGGKQQGENCPFAKPKEPEQGVREEPRKRFRDSPF
jgi:hypothetical protein